MCDCCVIYFCGLCGFLYTDFPLWIYSCCKGNFTESPNSLQDSELTINITASYENLFYSKLQVCPHRFVSMSPFSPSRILPSMWFFLHQQFYNWSHHFLFSVTIFLPHLVLAVHNVSRQLSNLISWSLNNVGNQHLAILYWPAWFLVHCDLDYLWLWLYFTPYHLLQSINVSN